MNYSKYTKKELIQIIENLESNSSDKAKDLFLSNISHDVRTLLNAIYGNAQILDNDENLNSVQKKSVKRIIEASSHMIDLINNIISISKNSGEDKVVLSQFNFNELLENIYSIFNTVAISKNLVLSINSSIPKDYIIKTDKNKLFYILLNIVGNAIKYTNKGEVSLTCSFMSNSKIHFEIKDTGIGIPQDQIKNITQEYIRANNSSKVEGFGLGLGIVCKNLSLLSSSKLKIKSELNKGSEFSFFIKCQKNSTTFVTTENEIFEMQEIESILDADNFLVLVYANNEDEKSILNSYFSSRNINYILVDKLDILKTQIKKENYNMIFIDSTELSRDEYFFFKEYKKQNNNIAFIILTSLVMSDELALLNEISTSYIVEPYSFLDIDQALIMFTNQKFSYVKKETDIQTSNLIIEKNLESDIIKEADLGNYKSCNNLIDKISDTPSRTILLEHLENYDFDEIINMLNKKENSYE